jgi:GAF domain-containing protein/anti-sigma regulatory factor (Ser/Thr protein kinase)
MQCPRCQQENLTSHKCCRECGTPLARLEGGAQPALSYAEMQRSLTEALEQQAATAEILRVISSSPTDLQPVLMTVAQNAARVCGAIDAQIYRVEGEFLHWVASHGPIPPNTEERLISRGWVTGRAVVDRRTIHVHDLATESDTEYPVGKAAQRQTGHRTTLATPLLREGVPLGVISIRRMEVRPFSEQQVTLLETFADQAVIAIENVRLFNETKQALEQQTATAEILRVISSSPTDIQPVLDAVAQAASRLCDAYDAWVGPLDGDVLRVAAHYGSIAVPVGEVVPAIRGTVPGRSVIDRRTVHVADLQEAVDEYPEGSELAQRLGFRTALSVPQLREGVPIGVIHIRRNEVRPFTDREVVLLQTFADQAVIAIENVRLFKELESRNRDLTATSEILRVIASSPTDLQPVFDAIAERSMRLCEATFGWVVMFDGALMHLRSLANVSPEGADALRQMFPLAPSRASAAGRTILTGDVVHMPDVFADPEYGFKNISHATNSRSVLTVPLLRQGRPIGAITVIRPEPGAFSGEQIQLLKTFADQAVIAIENVRLFTELQEKNRALTEAHAQVTEALEQQTATSEILRVISRSPTDSQPVFDAIARNAVALCDGIAAVVLRFDGEMLHVAGHHALSPQGVERNEQAYPRRPGRDYPPGRALLDRSVVHVPDLQAATEFAASTARQRGAGSQLAVPLLHDGQAIGVIGLARDAVGPFSSQQIEVLQTFADQAVIAIENVRLFKELEARNKDLTEALEQQTATAEILRVISRSQTDVQPVFDTIVRSAARLCDGLFSTLFQFDGELLHIIAVHNTTPEALEALHRVYPARPTRALVAARAILERTVVHISDAELELESEQRAVAHAVGWRSALIVPMLREGAPIGVVTVGRVEPGPFSDSEIELLKTFADQAVIAVENVRLFKALEARTAELTRSVEQLTALGEVGRAVSSTLDLETVLTTIVSRAVLLSGLDGGVVFEYDENTEEFVQRAATDPGGALAEARRTTRIRKGEGVLGRTAITLEPIQVPDITVPAAYEGRLRETLVESGVRAILAVPMVREGQLIGCLGVTRNQPGDFPAETIELLRTFATQSALAIQNARLFLEIEDKSRQLEAASRHKSEFLANMSHELRTPLNAVIGFSEVLLQRMFGELNTKQDEYLKDIYASGQHLLSLINDILDLSKIEAGRMELAPAPFHLPSALENAVTLVKERAARHGIALQVDFDPRLGEIVGDERKVKQVLLNLLSNAVKFTPEGGRISLKARRTDDTVEIAVTDTGIGIAPQDQAAIFEEFRQVGHDETRKQEGTGLGLTLAKKFVELHGGRIWVESEPGRGSTFTFTLPVS